MKTPAAVRLATLALFLLAVPSHEGTTALSVRVHAQETSAPPGEAGASAVQGQPSAGAWNFAEDKEDTPTWRQVVGSQAIDLVLFSAFGGLALNWSFFRKSVRLK